MTRSPDRTLIGAAAAFTVALFLFGSALLRAISADAGSSLEPPAPVNTNDAVATESPSLDADALMLAVENDPFSPDRTRPAERYRMPGDVEPEEPAPPPPPAPAPDFRLIGTVVFSPENGTAAIAVGDSDPRMMSVGENVMGYRLTAVTPQTATVSNGEREITLRVPSPSATIAAAPTGRGQNGRGNTGGRGGAPARGEAQQLQQIQSLIQRAVQGGATPAMLQQLQRLMVNGREDGLAEAMQMVERIQRAGTSDRMIFEEVPVQGGRIQVRPAPRRDSVVIRRPGGGGR